MRLFVTLLVFVAIGFAQEDVPPVNLRDTDGLSLNTISDHDRAASISRLAYAPAEFGRRNMDPQEATQGLLRLQERATRFFSTTKSGVDPEVRRRAAAINQYDKSLQVVAANRDAIAMLQTDPQTGKQNLQFGFRGTHDLRDLVPDFQLAINAKKIPRLDQARDFVRDVRSRYPQIPNDQLQFQGHSLGGFIAEGVGNDYPGSRTSVVSPGAPVLRRGSEIPRAFNPRQPGSNLPIRYYRSGDLVPMGIKNMGPGINREELKVSANPLDDHFLSADLPWYVRSRSALQSAGIRARWALRGARNKTRDAFRNVGQRLNNVRQNISNRFNNVRQNIGNRFNNVRQRTRQIGQNIGNRFINVRQNIGNRFNNVRQNIGNRFNNVRHNIGNRFNNVRQRTRQIGQNIGNRFNNVRRNIGNRFNNVRRNIVNRFNNVRQRTRQIGQNIGRAAGNARSNVSGWFNNLRTRTGAAASGIRNTIKRW